jgi:hypothetical protein
MHSSLCSTWTHSHHRVVPEHTVVTTWYLDIQSLPRGTWTHSRYHVVPGHMYSRQHVIPEHTIIILLYLYKHSSPHGTWTWTYLHKVAKHTTCLLGYSLTPCSAWTHSHPYVVLEHTHHKMVPDNTMLFARNLTHNHKYVRPGHTTLWHGTLPHNHTAETWTQIHFNFWTIVHMQILSLRICNWHIIDLLIN